MPDALLGTTNCLTLYVYIISEISIKIKLFLSKFSLIESAEAVLNRLHHARPPLFHLLGEFEPFP